MTGLPARIAHTLRVRPRLLISAAAAGVVSLMAPSLGQMRPITQGLLGWNAGIWLYLVLALWMMARSDAVYIQKRARTQDEGATAILLLVVLAALASLLAIVAELSVTKADHTATRSAHIALTVATILGSWAFTQVMFALHYAHDYYAERASGRAGGLQFPDTEAPDYLDFLYFSVVIGTSAQTADVAFATSRLRRVGLVHCILAFLFNASLIALMINVGSSLL
jgi:uncharacterized membrane protein